MTYYLYDDVLTNPRTEHAPAELIARYESGSLDGAALVATRGDTRWSRLDKMLSLLRQDVSGPLHDWRERQASA